MQQTAVISAENTGKTLFNVLYWNHNITNLNVEFLDRFLNIIFLINIYSRYNVVGIKKMTDIIRDKNVIFMETNNVITAFALKFIHDNLVLYGKAHGITLGEWKADIKFDWEYNKSIHEILTPSSIYSRLRNNLFSYYLSRHWLDIEEVPYKVINIQNFNPGHVFTEEQISKEYNISPIIERRDPELIKNSFEKSIQEYIELIAEYSEKTIGTRVVINEDELNYEYDNVITRLKNLDVRVD